MYGNQVGSHTTYHTTFVKLTLLTKHNPWDCVQSSSVAKLNQTESNGLAWTAFHLFDHRVLLVWKLNSNKNCVFNFIQLPNVQ